MARSSAVLMVEVPVPMNCGTYVTRARRGIVGLCCHDEVASKGSEEQLRSLLIEQIGLHVCGNMQVK